MLARKQCSGQREWHEQRPGGKRKQGKNGDFQTAWKDGGDRGLSPWGLGAMSQYNHTTKN